ncbi:hypothetical protein [Actinoplanes sp. NPDC049681]|uniref:hypothetical protein n=1 Tax=Actinoplanes sp. NPDC049681 TaxID=3363905 RepID=UPI00378BAE31
MRLTTLRTRLTRAVLTVALAAGGGLAIGGTASPAAADGTDYAAAAADEAYWISLAQVPDGHGRASGAISVNIPAGGITGATDALVRPYLANLAIPGLVKGGPRYYPAARAYLTWYLNHVQWPDQYGVHGTVCDYRIDVTTGTEHLIDGSGRHSGTCFYDSSDGYAGTFLVAMRAYAEANPGDAGWVAQQAYLLDTIGNVIKATQQTDKLTGAKPDWPAEYLMDNVEAQRGLAALSWLMSNVVGNAYAGEYWAAEADRMAAAIQTYLYSPVAGMYGNDVGAVTTCAAGGRCPTWDGFYPTAEDESNAVGQVWPVLAELGPAEQRQQLWARFTAHWPQWTGACEPTASAAPCGGTPWAVLAQAAVVQGDLAGARAYVAGARGVWGAAGRPWPWTVADSGWLALAEDALAHA